MAAPRPPPDADGNRSRELLTVTWIFCALSSLVVGLRLYVRVRMTRNLWWDDWVMFFTMTLTIAFSAFFTVYAAKGGTRHVVSLSPAQLEETTKINWASQTFCIMAIATGKISVAILMGRLMSPNRWRRWVLYFLSVSTFVASSIVIIFIFAQCSPPKALWIPGAGTCWDPKKINDLDVAMGSWSAFVDFALAMFGITLIWNLQIDRREKAGLCVLLGLGIFSSICAAVKTSYLPTLTVHSDFTWITVDLLIWNALEINVIIIAGCLPVLRPVFRKLFYAIQSRVSTARKTPRKLSSPSDGPSYELSTKNAQAADHPSREAAAYGWQNEHGSQTNIVPTNRILEVRDIDTRFEEQGRAGREKDEEYGWNGSRAAISTRTVL